MMAGWSTAGTRPSFTLVTGISTGALMFTFVFIGQTYDQQLKEMYTTDSTKDLVIKRSILEAITGISINSLIRTTQGIGDMYRIYLDCQRDDIDFNLAYISDDFDVTPEDEFDSIYMSKLFDLGHNLAKDGYPWKKAPPGFE